MTLGLCVKHFSKTKESEKNKVTMERSCNRKARVRFNEEYWYMVIKVW